LPGRRPFIYLADADVRRLLTPADAVEQAELALRRQAEGAVTWSEPRWMTVSPADRTLRYAAKACELDGEYGGFRVAMVDRHAAPAPDGPADPAPSQLTLLCDATRGRLLAVIDEEYMHALRTGAGAAVAARHCAVAGPQTVALIGAGRLAGPTYQALAAAVDIAEVRIASRRPESRDALARELGSVARAVADVESAVRDATIVITATTAREPLVRAEWLRPDAFVYAMGDAEELEPECYRTATRVMADDWVQCQVRPQMSGLIADGVIARDAVISLWQVIGGSEPARRDADGLLVMRSQGLVTQDVAIAALVYRRAVEDGLGVPLPGDAAKAPRSGVPSRPLVGSDSDRPSQ
jgi:alanine dehydrogenase